MFIGENQGTGVESVVITRQSNPPISQFDSPCNEFTSFWSMFVYNSFLHVDILKSELIWFILLPLISFPTSCVTFCFKTHLSMLA